MTKVLLRATSQKKAESQRLWLHAGANFGLAWRVVFVWSRCCPALLSSALVSLFDSLIQGLKHARIHRGDDIHRRIQLFFSHSGFPCVRKAPFYSWVAKPHHRHRQPDEHLLPVSETGHRVGVTIENPKIRFIQSVTPFSAVWGMKATKEKQESTLSLYSWDFFPTQNAEPGTRNFLLVLVRLHATDKGVRKAALDVHMVAMAVPREVIFL